MCVDYDECLKANGGCQRRCKNTLGSFECMCEAGFQLLQDGKNCKG